MENRVAGVYARPLASGLLVLHVTPGFTAAKAGSQPGDILTAYDGKVLRTLADLRKFSRGGISPKQGSEPPIGEKVSLAFFRGGKGSSIQVARGALGVETVSVVKGQGRARRPETRFEPDLAAIRPGGSWYQLRMSGQMVGFQRSAVAVDQGEVRLDSHTRLRAEQKDVDLRVRVVMGRGPDLPLRSLAMAASDTPILYLQKASGLMFGGAPREKTVAPLTVTIPERLASTWAIGALALTMPRKVGACRYFSALDEGEVAVRGRYELHCAAQERIVTASGPVQAFRYDATRFGVTTSRYWITADHRTVKVDFRGFTAELTTPEAAVAQLPAGLSPTLPPAFAPMPELKLPGSEFF